MFFFYICKYYSKCPNYYESTYRWHKPPIRFPRCWQRTHIRVHPVNIFSCKWHAATQWRQQWWLRDERAPRSWSTFLLPVTRAEGGPSPRASPLWHRFYANHGETPFRIHMHHIPIDESRPPQTYNDIANG